MLDSMNSDFYKPEKGRSFAGNPFSTEHRITMRKKNSIKKIKYVSSINFNEMFIENIGGVSCKPHQFKDNQRLPNEQRHVVLRYIEGTTL